MSRGKQHYCRKGTRIDNLTSLVTVNPTEGEKIVAAIRKVKCPPLSDAQPSTSQQILSCKQLVNIQVDMNLTTNQTLKLASHIRVATTNRFAVEKHLKKNLAEMNHSLDAYFEVEKVEFVVSKTKRGEAEKVETPTACCYNLKGLVKNVLEKKRVCKLSE